MPTEEPTAPVVDRGAKRRARTRSALLGAAFALFAERGIEATRIADITERADVGFGSFYNHFADKDELTREVVDAAIETQGRIVDELADGLEDPAEVVAVAHRHFVRLASDREQSAWLLVRTDFSDRILSATVGDRAWRPIERGVASGRFDVPDAAAALHATGGALTAVMREALRRGALVDAERRGVDPPAAATFGGPDDETGPIDDVAHAELVLRILGLPSEEAHEVASRPMPGPPDGD
ncbi:MAG: TetR/AcrR family transcriptional regulator [Solirubrobacteraceae bacterium]|nr:TetR/AcrR family transcriptional regulator [Solirubrobacteraceae bacterium]